MTAYWQFCQSRFTDTLAECLFLKLKKLYNKTSETFVGWRLCLYVLNKSTDSTIRQFNAQFAAKNNQQLEIINKTIQLQRFYINKYIVHYNNITEKEAL